MNTTTEAYAIGEEVVVRLSHARVFDPRLGVELRTRRVPPWMIARIIHSEATDGRRRYVLVFQHRHAGYLCSVDDRAIEGTA